MIEPLVPAAQDSLPEIPAAESPAIPENPPEALGQDPSQLPPPEDLPAIPTDLPGPVDPAAAPEPGEAAPFGPLEDQKQEMQKSDEGFIIKDAGLNDIFQFLAKSAGRQYFHNTKINGPDFLVTGHLNDGNPLQQMEELAFMYGLSLHVKGNTIYALTQAQLSQLPNAEFHYQLRYLRPTDMEQIKELIKPLLSPGTGIVNFEPKTNTIIIIDSTHRIEQARELLHGIDQAKGQVIVETKILRVNSGAAERTRHRLAKLPRKGRHQPRRPRSISTPSSDCRKSGTARFRTRTSCSARFSLTACCAPSMTAAWPARSPIPP